MNIKSKINIFRGIIFALYIVGGACLLLSIVCETFFKGSFISLVSSLICPDFLRASVVFEIIKIIGFSNVFLGWFYANLDKKMIGLSYSNILNFFFPFHHCLTIIHILCNILCIAFSSASLSESAVVSLALVLNGFIYQWIALYFIVLNSKCCEELAEYIWKNDINRRNSSTILSSLFCLSQSFDSKNTRHYKKNLECFSAVLTEFVKHDSNINNLKSVAEVWENIPNSYDSNDILLDVLENMIADTNELKEAEQKKHCLCEVISAYMVYKIHFTNQSLDGNCVQENFERLIKQMWSLKHYLSMKIASEHKKIYDDFSNCIETNIYMLAWILFQYRTISLTKEFLEIVPQKINDKFINKVAYVLFGPVVKDQDSIDVALQVAQSQLENRLVEMGNR